MPPLQQQRRPHVQRGQCLPELEALICPDGHLCLGCRLHVGSEPAIMTEKGRKVRGMPEAVRMADRARKFARLAIELCCLVRVAKVPQVEREVATVSNAGVVAGIGAPELCLLAVVESRECLLVADTSRVELGAVEHRRTLHE